MLVQVKHNRLNFNHNLTTGVGGGGREALPQLSLYYLAFQRTPVMCRRVSVEGRAVMISQLCGYIIYVQEV